MTTPSNITWEPTPTGNVYNGPSWSSDLSSHVSSLLSAYLSKSGTIGPLSTNSFGNWVNGTDLTDLYSNSSIPVDPTLSFVSYNVSEFPDALKGNNPFPYISNDLDDITTNDTLMSFNRIANPASLTTMANAYGPTSSVALEPSTAVSLVPSVSTMIPHANYAPAWRQLRYTSGNTSSYFDSADTVTSQNSASTAVYAAPTTNQCVNRCLTFANNNVNATPAVTDCIGFCQGSYWSSETDAPQLTDLWMPTIDPTTRKLDMVQATVDAYNDGSAPVPVMTKLGCNAYINALNNTPVSCPSGKCWTPNSTTQQCELTTDQNCTSGSCDDICGCCTLNGFTTGACSGCAPNSGNPLGTDGEIKMVIGLFIVIAIGLFIYHHYGKGKK